MTIRLMAYALGLLFFSCGGDGGGVNDPPATATFSGVVREQGSGAPVAGASVSMGGVTATSGQNGQFELRNVPLSTTLNLTVTAPGYEPLTQSVSVQSGSNLTLTIVRTGLYDVSNYVVYLPPNITSYRGVFVVMFGGDVDTRQLLRGNVAYYQQFPLSGDVASYRQRMLDLASSQGFAVLGGVFPAQTNYASIFNAITTVATQSSHSELSNAPLLLHGHSARGCVAYDFAVTHPARILGLIVGKAAACLGSGASAAASIPAYFIYGENDPQVSADAAAGARAFVESNRASGAPWAFAIEPGAGHAQVEDQDVIFNWLNAVVTLRLPSGTATPRAVVESAGWLGDSSTRAIGAYPCFTGNKATASWLPSELTARDWQRLLSRGTVTALQTC